MTLFERWAAAEPHRFAKVDYDWRRDYTPTQPQPDAHVYRDDADNSHAEFLASYHLEEAARWMRVAQETSHAE